MSHVAGQMGDTTETWGAIEMVRNNSRKWITSSVLRQSACSGDTGHLSPRGHYYTGTEIFVYHQYLRIGVLQVNLSIQSFLLNNL